MQSLEAFLPAADFAVILQSLVEQGAHFFDPAARSLPPAPIRCALVPNRTGRIFSRKTPIWIDLDRQTQSLRVVDSATGQYLTTCPMIAVRATTAQHLYSGKTSYLLPMIHLHLPAHEPISIGMPDFRFTWKGEVENAPAADYVVGGTDWATLVDELGLRSRLDVKPSA